MKSVTGRDISLKRSYRNRLALSFGISAATYLSLAFLTILFLQNNTPIEAKIPVRTIGDYKDIVRIRTIVCPLPTPGTPHPVIPPTTGEPIPVPDIQAPEYSAVPTQDQLFLMASYDPMDWNEQGNIIINANSIIDEILPPSDTFIAFEEAPVPVRSVDPVYPELARRAGLEADIWIKVLIDTNGNVRDVLIANSSERTAGFEQSAKKAAYSTVWKPAIANGQPVAVWVTYKVSFRLK